MTTKQLIENKIRTIVKKVLKEANSETAVSKFAKLSGLTPKKTISNRYPTEFTISKTMTMIVSDSGKFIMTYRLNGQDEYLASYDSAARAWQAVEQGNYMGK
jgi:hypothetical protein